MKFHRNGQRGAELFLICCEETANGNPLFQEGDIFSVLCPPPSCSSHYLSCLYMWKTEQQTAASITLRPAPAELDFPPFPQRLWEVGHCSLTKKNTGAEKSPVCAFISSPNKSWSGHKQVYLGCVFPLTITATHKQCFDMWKGYCQSLSNRFCRKLFPPLVQRSRLDPNAVSSEVCVCSSTRCVCLLLHQGLDEWLYWLHGKKNSGYYWYS